MYSEAFQCYLFSVTTPGPKGETQDNGNGKLPYILNMQKRKAAKVIFEARKLPENTIQACSYLPSKSTASYYLSHTGPEVTSLSPGICSGTPYTSHLSSTTPSLSQEISLLCCQLCHKVGIPLCERGLHLGAGICPRHWTMPQGHVIPNLGQMRAKLYPISMGLLHEDDKKTPNKPIFS